MPSNIRDLYFITKEHTGAGIESIKLIILNVNTGDVNAKP